MAQKLHTLQPFVLTKLEVDCTQKSNKFLTTLRLTNNISKESQDHIAFHCKIAAFPIFSAKQ